MFFVLVQPKANVRYRALSVVSDADRRSETVQHHHDVGVKDHANVAARTAFDVPSTKVDWDGTGAKTKVTPNLRS